MEKKLIEFISPQAQNELNQTMAILVLHDLVSAIQCTPFFNIIVDLKKFYCTLIMQELIP